MPDVVGVLFVEIPRAAVPHVSFNPIHKQLEARLSGFLSAEDNILTSNPLS